MRRRGMRMGRNPLASTIEKNATYSHADSATRAGVVLRATIMTSIMLVIGGIMFQNIVTTNEVTGFQIMMLIVGSIVGFVSVLVGVRSLRLSKFFAIIYAAMQGFVLGTISGLYEVMFGDGIVLTAILATAGVVFAMLFLYKSGIIKVTDRFRSIMFSLLLGYVFFSFIMFILSFFGMGLFAGTANLGILLVISAVAVVLASFFLLIDFDNIEQMVSNNVDRRYEWVLALSLMVTIVWLYVEILRLLAILASRSRN